MGAGSLLELVALGKQDKHIIGNPEISFFKSVFKRHTNFSIENIPNQFTSSAKFNDKGSCIIERKGDLLSSMHLQIELPQLASATTSWINGAGNHIIKEVELQMGGIQIARFTGEYLDLISSLTVPQSKSDGYYKMVGKHSSYSNTSQRGPITLFVPLPFWFCKDISNALPLIGLQYSEIKVNIKFRPFSECWYSGSNVSGGTTEKEITSVYLYCDYIYLDTFERKKFATMCDKHYLIEQVQEIKDTSISASIVSKSVDLYFNHPIKELIWIYRANEQTTYNIWDKYGKNPNGGNNEAPISNVELFLNNNSRFEKRKGEYFRLMQPYQRHTSVPTTNYIYVYSFALMPEKFQPTGTCNFSRLDNTTLEVEFESSILAGSIVVYAINYNILQITNGMAGLLYTS
jgi:hypothetical protein